MQTSSAYGVAVTTTMVITTLLLHIVARDRWNWPRWAALSVTATLLTVDLAFFGSSIIKVAHGGWVPLLVAGLVFLLMSTWKRGRQILSERLRTHAVPAGMFMARLAKDPPRRVPGVAVFLTGRVHGVPWALLRNLSHNQVLHDQVVMLTVVTDDVPWVEEAEQLEVESLGEGLHQVVSHTGFMQSPDVPRTLELAAQLGVEHDPEHTTYFLSRERLIPTPMPGMALWREWLFAFMARNAQGAAAHFRLPRDQVIEFGSQVEI